MLRAGDLNRRVTLQRAVTAKDKNNNPVTSWADIGKVWAGFTPVSDGEKLRAGERAADLGARFVIRHSRQVADLNPADRLIFNGRVHQITGVKEFGGRSVGLEITTVARGDA